jgi:hypothetical protein
MTVQSQTPDEFLNKLKILLKDRGSTATIGPMTDIQSLLNQTVPAGVQTVSCQYKVNNVLFCLSNVTAGECATLGGEVVSSCSGLSPWPHPPRG